MNVTVNRRALFVRVKQITQFCIVGGSGVVVDMAVLFLLAEPFTYLKDVLERLPRASNQTVANLTPLAWKNAREVSLQRAA